jgi:hypothetical protein
MKMSSGSVISEINDSEVNIRFARRDWPPLTTWMIAYMANVAKGANVTGILAVSSSRSVACLREWVGRPTQNYLPDQQDTEFL